MHRRLTISKNEFPVRSVIVVDEPQQAEMIVITHGKCIDGMAAAAVIYGWLTSERRPKGVDRVYFHPGFYHKPPPSVYDDQDVVIADFCYPLKRMRELVENSKSLTVLDHHATAQKDCQSLFDEGLVHGVFDMRRSGAAIAWDWFFGFGGGRTTADDRPLLINYVSDRDLWKLELPQSSAVSRWLGCLPFDLTQENLAKWWEAIRTFKLDDRMECVLEGVERMVNAGAHQFAEGAWNVRVTVEIEGEEQSWEVPIINCPNFWSSEALDYILQQDESIPFALAVSITNAGQGQGELPVFYYSLRARTGFDGAAVAKALGGGGHKAAAGFRLDNEELRIQILEKLSPGIRNGEFMDYETPKDS